MCTPQTSLADRLMCNCIKLRSVIVTVFLAGVGLAAWLSPSWLTLAATGAAVVLAAVAVALAVFTAGNVRRQGTWHPGMDGPRHPVSGPVSVADESPDLEEIREWWERARTGENGAQR